jgi:predicted AAA+ superfamily ATPase
MTGYLPREIADVVHQALASLPVVALTGMRQTGKTTFLREQPELRGRRYLTLDDFALLEAARRDPEGLLDGDAPLTIDEAQRCPELLLAIKRAVDHDRRPGQYLLSGSANFALLHGIAETLAGRAIYLQLHPLSRRELSAARSQPFLRALFDQPDHRPRRGSAQPAVPAEDVLLGGMPPVRLGDPRSASFWFTAFEQTYIERDVRALSQVADLISFRRVLHLAALRTGQVLNQSDLGRDAQLSAATAGRYLGLLETSFLVARLPPFLGNRATRRIKAPKIYLADAGLAAHLAGVHALDAEIEEPLRGPLLETYVCHNLLALLGARWPAARLCYWHIQGRHEVDFVIESGRDCLAIEVKSGSRWKDRDISGLQAFLAATPRCRAALLAYTGEEVVSLGDRLWAAPIGVVLG